MEHSQKKGKTPSKGDELFAKIIPWVAICGTIAFFMGAGSGAYEPSEVFSKLFGFVVIGSVLVAVLVIIVAVFSRLFDFLVGEK